MQNTIRDLSELGRLDRTQSPKQAYIMPKKRNPEKLRSKHEKRKM